MGIVNLNLGSFVNKEKLNTVFAVYSINESFKRILMNAACPKKGHPSKSMPFEFECRNSQISSLCVSTLFLTTIAVFQESTRSSLSPRSTGCPKKTESNFKVRLFKDDLMV